MKREDANEINEKTLDLEEAKTPNFAFSRRAELLKRREKKLPLINPRLFVFTALGLVFGILLYTRIRFGFLKPTDLIPFLLILFASACSFSGKRTAAVFLCFFLFAGTGAGLMHLACNRFSSTLPAGEYSVTGTVVSFTKEEGQSSLLLDNLSFNGEKASGKMYLTLASEELRTGDIISVAASVKPCELAGNSSYTQNLLIKDVRYLAGAKGEFQIVGKGNAFLRLNARVYDALYKNLDRTQASAAYALLTGNSGGMDESFALSVRQGGAAHIFAVSGLHIGILYGAVSLLFAFCRRYRFFPAITAAILYSAFCGFTVSSVRAVIMCAVMGAYRIWGRKYDFLSSSAFACTAVLLFAPAEWLSAGFRLSFGACLGLALFARPLKKLFKKLPAFFREYLSANLAVQIFTFPILIESFGYFSVWGTLLNLFLIPVLPVLFLGLFLCTVFALIIPSAAQIFFSVPNGMLSSFALLFSLDFSLVVTGITLGTSGTVYLVGTTLLSERVNLKPTLRLASAALLAVPFIIFFALENTVIAGCKLTATRGAVLVETNQQHILIIDGEQSADAYSDFLSRSYAGSLDAVVVLSENQTDGVSAALSLPAEEIHVYEDAFTGLSETPLYTEKSFTCGALLFRYESAEKLTVIAEDRTVEIDFSNGENLDADLFLAGKGVEVYYLFKSSVYRVN